MSRSAGSTEVVNVVEIAPGILGRRFVAAVVRGSRRRLAVGRR
jgi:hypothetical protein